jgi:MFS family permease
MRKATLKDVLVLNAYWVGLSFMWNSLHVIILPAVLLFMVPERLKNTYLGLLTFVGLIIAILVQPVSGALSDRWNSRFGRRRPLIAVGTLFDFVFLIFLGWAGGLIWLAIGYLGLQFSSNIAHGPVQGLLPDQVPEEQLGWASGFKNLMDMAGLVVSSLLVGSLLKPDVRHPVVVVGLVAVVLAAGALITLLGVREKPNFDPRPQLSLKKTIREAFQVDLMAHRAFAWLIASRLFFLAGIYGIQTFAQYYVRDVLAVPNPIQLTGNLLAAITLALIFFAVLGGWLGDRIGHRRMSALASLIGALGCLALVWARTPATLLAFGSLLGMGIGLFLTANWAMANQLAPAAEAGKFLGLTNLATAGAGVIGRLEGPLIDLFNNWWPGLWWGYTGLFLAGAVCLLASAVLLRKIPVVPRVTRPVSQPV